MDFLDRIRTRAEQKRRGSYLGEYIRRGLCGIQHDMNIANASGATVRGDLNNALVALTQLSSGATAPSTTYAYQKWADTTAGLLKQRNAANTDWVVRDTLAETLAVSRSSDTVLAAADYKKFFVATASFTQTLTAAATLGDKWYVHYRVGAGLTVILDPNSTETVDGATTKSLVGPCSGTIFCNGSAFFTYGFDFKTHIHGADIASAGTVNLDTATGDLVDVTGTTTITAITLADGREATVRFTGVLTLTHGASLVLPGGVNITTAAGDFAVFRGYAAGIVRCVSYNKASGLPPVDIGLTKLASGTVSAAATLDIVMTAFTAYKNKLLVLISFIPVTDGVALRMQFSTNGGSSYDAGASDYGSAFRTLNTVGATGDSFGAFAQIQLSSAFIGNLSAEGIDVAITLYDTTNTAVPTRCTWQAAYSDTAGAFTHNSGMGGRTVAQDTDALLVLFSSGNIASGSWALYGYN